MQNFDLKKLDTITKYPSIETYHKVNGKKLHPELTPGISYSGQKTYVLEKVDGMNTREVYLIEDGTVSCFIGSRDDLVAENGEIPENFERRILDFIHPVTLDVRDRLAGLKLKDGIFVIYHELYGNKIQDGRQYTNIDKVGVRVFDMMYIPMEKFASLMDMELMHLSTWRRKGGQPFLSFDEVQVKADMLELDCVPVVAEFDGDDIPTSLEDAYIFLCAFRKTQVSLNEGHAGISEGIVPRTLDRKMIAKLRFEDYEKTLGLRGKSRKNIEKDIFVLRKSGEYENKLMFLQKLLEVM